MDKVLVWVELVCETCASTTEGMFITAKSANAQIKHAIYSARANGWTIDGHKLTCPRCK